MIEKNYVTIQGWMAERLKLKGNELIAYAFIYGFTQNKERQRISFSYLARWLGSSRQTAIATIRRLEERGLIEKTQRLKNGQKENYYLPSQETPRVG
jgi:DNA-binding MarR family transcriptional regulator